MPTDSPSVSAISGCMGEPELGYVSLVELRNVRGKLGLPIERDLHFEADNAQQTPFRAAPRFARGEAWNAE